MEQSSFDSQVIGQKDKSKSILDVWKQVWFSPCNAYSALLFLILQNVTKATYETMLQRLCLHIVLWGLVSTLLPLPSPVIQCNTTFQKLPGVIFSSNTPALPFKCIGDLHVISLRRKKMVTPAFILKSGLRTNARIISPNSSTNFAIVSFFFILLSLIAPQVLQKKKQKRTGKVETHFSKDKDTDYLFTLISNR